MADSVLWQILEAARDGLRTDLVFTAQGTDTIADIEDEAILIRKVKVAQREHEQEFRSDRTPGILITPPLKVIRDPEEGTNTRDDVSYPLLFQIIDSDQHDQELNLRTYLKWQEQIAKYFNQQRLSAVQNVEGFNCINMVIQTDVVDEELWAKHGLFVAGVVVHFQTREPRGITS